MKRIISSLCISTLLIAACNEHTGETNQESKTIDSSTAKKGEETTTPAAPLLMASYAGMLPCADCESQAVTLMLMSDSSYKKTSLYMGRKSTGAGSNELTDTGKWVMKGDTLLLDIKNAPGQYIKSDSGLVQLDMKGKRITGKLADKYVLKQTH
jgi:uncharacterized lipoprotein NlpE involved in copper resistance